MGRPSLADVRRPQLLEAYAACLVRYGVQGTTLDRVAKEAGVTRGLVRHYLGNREAVIRALGDWAREGYLAFMETVAGRHPEEPLAALLDLAGEEQPKELYAVLDALFAEADRDPYIADVLREVYEAFFKWMVAMLSRGLPGSDPVARRQVALALISFGWADTGFEVIRFRPSRQRDFRALTQRLIDTLR